MNILLIEDSTPFSEYVEELLDESPECQIALARADRLESGLSLLTGNKTDLVLLDLSLPDSEGLRTLTRVLSKHPAMPCIVLTGRTERTLGIEAVKSGAVDFLHKDEITADSLVRSIYYAIERKAAANALMERVSLAEITVDIGRVLTQSAAIPDMLHNCAESLKKLPAISLVRIRTFNKVSGMLELKAAAGPDAFLDDPTAMERGCLFDIDLITKNKTEYVTDNILSDPYFLAKSWAKDNNITAAAVYPLLLEGDTLGLLSVFSSRTLSDPYLLTLSSIADMLKLGIQRKESEIQLAKNEARNRAVIQSSLDCLITIDKRGRIIEFNPAAERTFGHSRQDVLGKDICDIIVPEEFRQRHRAGIARYLSTRESHIIGQRTEFSALRADGTKFPIELAIVEIATEDEPVFTAFIRDLTEEKKAAERARRIHQLEQREDFTATLTHDLKNPLIGASRILTLFLEGTIGTLTDEQHQLMAQLHTSNTRLLAMINKLLDVYRLDKAVDRLCLETMDLVRLVKGCLDDMSHLAHSHKVKLQADLPVMLTARIDSFSIRRVLYNLLDNAIKFSPNGGCVQVKLEHSGNNVLLTVSDNGRGIAVTDQDKLFQRFWHGGEGNQYEPGTGLGLYICKQIVDSHGGEITCQSASGAGTTFTVTLPVAGADVDERADIGVKPAVNIDA